MAKGFVYALPKGGQARDAAILARIKRLAIPPAWTDVWISLHANGHLQATGRDARGRKQYRYHADWRQQRDASKFGRMIAFAQALPRIRRRVKRDLQRRGMPREKVLATVVRLLEVTLIRVGNDEYARENHSFGLTTMRNGHARVAGQKIHFAFSGKSGKRHDITLHDPQLARIVRRCQDLPGQELFRYEDEAGAPHSIHSQDVNDYIRGITGEDFTAKDFRTWAGTGARCHRPSEIGGGRRSGPRQEERRGGDPGRRANARQHAGGVSQELRASRRFGILSGWGYDRGRVGRGRMARRVGGSRSSSRRRLPCFCC